DEAADLRIAGPHVPADLDATALGKLDIHDGDVGAGGGDPGHRLSHGPRLAHDGHVGFRFESAPEAESQDLVVIDEEDADHGPTLRLMESDEARTPLRMSSWHNIRRSGHYGATREC